MNPQGALIRHRSQPQWAHWPQLQYTWHKALCKASREMNTSVWHMIVKYTSQITMPYTLISRFLRQSLCREEESKLRKNCSSEHFDGKILIKEETFRKWLAFFCLFTLFISINLFCKHSCFFFPMFVTDVFILLPYNLFYYLSLICTDSKKVFFFFSQPFGSFKECPIKSPHTNLT